MVSVNQITLFKNVSPEEIFHLDNGLKVSNIRDLVHQLELMNDKTFKAHVNEEKNDFANWIRYVFKDDVLANRLHKSNKKEEIIQILEDRIVELEAKKMKEFGLNVDKNTLIQIESFMMKRYDEGQNDSSIKEELLKEGFNKNLIELMINLSDATILNLDNFENKTQALEKVSFMEVIKKYLVKNVADGVPISAIKEFLLHKGWDEHIVDFIVYDIFKPHPELYKLKNYIKIQIEKKGQDINNIKTSLKKIGWEEYIIDFVINGIKEPKNTPLKAIKYLENFSLKRKKNLSKYLEELGWTKIKIKGAFQSQKSEHSITKIRKFLESKGLTLVEAIQETKDHHLFKLKRNIKGKKVRKALLDISKEVDITEKIEENSLIKIKDSYFDLHNLPDIISEKSYFSLNKILMFTDTIYFNEKSQFLLIYHKSEYYLALPIVKKRMCMACGKEYPENLVSKVEFWNDDRTQKVVKYVCKDHEGIIKNLMLDKKLIQG